MIDEYIKQWLTKADNDLKIVEHELDLPEKEIVKDIVCFHCQQAVEKYLKAFLIYHKAEVERTHDIEHLLNQCALIDKDFVNIEVRELSKKKILENLQEPFFSRSALREKWDKIQYYFFSWHFVKLVIKI